MGVLTRLEGWPERLATVLDRHLSEPYNLGTSDCLTLACEAVKAVTGVDYWPRFAGYRTKRQAFVTIGRVGRTFSDAVTNTLGIKPMTPMASQRGDLAMFRDAVGEDHLGVVTSKGVLVRLADGTVTLPVTHEGLLCAWRIG